MNADVRRRRRRHRARFQVAARVGHGRHLEHLEHPEHLEHHLAGGSPFEWKGDRPVERPVESASRASLASRASRASSCRRFAFRVEGRPARRAARRVGIPSIPSISSIPSIPSISSIILPAVRLSSGRATGPASGPSSRHPEHLEHPERPEHRRCWPCAFYGQRRVRPATFVFVVPGFFFLSTEFPRPAPRR